jgi:two-component system NtrC family response regulator
VNLHDLARSRALGLNVPRVLVVDDDDPIRESIRLALDIIGIEVVAVESGERALEAFARAPFDGAIVDLMMPGMNGLDTVLALRSRAPDLPVVVISGSLMHASGSVPDLVRVATGMSGVTSLAKPFKLSDLLNVARKTFMAPRRPETKPAA